MKKYLGSALALGLLLTLIAVPAAQASSPLRIDQARSTAVGFTMSHVWDAPWSPIVALGPESGVQVWDRVDAACYRVTRYRVDCQMSASDSNYHFDTTPIGRFPARAGQATRTATGRSASASPGHGVCL